MKIIKVIFLCLLSICVFENNASAAWEPGSNTCYLYSTCGLDNNSNFAMLFYIDEANEGGYYYFPPHIRDEFVFYNHLNEPKITYKFFSIYTNMDDNKKYLCYVDAERRHGKSCDSFIKDQFKSNVKDCNGRQQYVDVPRNYFKRGNLDNLSGSTIIHVETSSGIIGINNCYEAARLLPDAFNGNPTSIPEPIYQTVPIGGDPVPEECDVKQTFKNNTSYDQMIYFNNDKNKYFYVPSNGELTISFNNYSQYEIPSYQRSVFMKIKDKNDNNGYLCELYDEHKDNIELEVVQTGSGTECEGEKSITANDDNKAYNNNLEKLLGTTDESKFKIINISEYDGDDYTYDGYGADFACYPSSYLVSNETNFTTKKDVYSDPCFYQTKLKYINTTSYDQVIYFDDSKYFYIPANGSTVITFKNYANSEIPSFKRYVFMKTKDMSDNVGFMCELTSAQAKNVKYPFPVLDSVSTRLCDDTPKDITSSTGKRDGDIEDVLSTVDSSNYRNIFVFDYKGKEFDSKFDCYSPQYVIGKNIQTYGEGSSTSKSKLSGMNNSEYVYTVSDNEAISGSNLYINIPRYIVDKIKNNINNIVAKLYIIDENKNKSKKEVYILNESKATFEKYNDSNITTLGNGTIRYNKIKLENYNQNNLAIMIKQKGYETNKIKAVLYISDPASEDYYLNLSKSLTSNGTLPTPANGYINLSNNENKIGWADYKVFDKEGNVVWAGSRKLNPYDNITLSLTDLLKKHPEYYDYLISFYSKNQHVHVSVYYEGDENQSISPLNLRSAKSNILTSERIKASDLEATTVYKEKVAGNTISIPHKKISEDDENATIEELVVVNKGYESEVVVESENTNGAIQSVSFDNPYNDYLYPYVISKEDFLPNATNGAKVIDVNVNQPNILNSIYKACVKDYNHTEKRICFYNYGIKVN